MVAKVYGMAGGQHITFNHADGDVWKADVPWRDDGTYAVEIYAEDDAGNIAYLCTMLFVISGHELQCVISDRGYAGTGTLSGYGSVELEKKYEAELKEGGYTIERTVCSRGICGLG